MVHLQSLSIRPCPIVFFLTWLMLDRLLLYCGSCRRVSMLHQRFQESCEPPTTKDGARYYRQNGGRNGGGKWLVSRIAAFLGSKICYCCFLLQQMNPLPRAIAHRCLPCPSRRHYSPGDHPVRRPGTIFAICYRT